MSYRLTASREHGQAHAGEAGYLDEGDLDEGANSLFKAGDDSDLPWFIEGAHGQPQQRLRAFEIGLEEGVDGCMLDSAFQ